jgi:ABC-type long-subunit fatty acid transport system fused permease/ATPase subunit
MMCILTVVQPLCDRWTHTQVAALEAELVQTDETAANTAAVSEAFRQVRVQFNTLYFHFFNTVKFD